MTDIALNQPADAGFFSPGERVRTVRLYGRLGATFGRVHQFVCSDTAGAIRALCAMVPGFQKFLLESKDKGLGYTVFIGRENIGEDMLQTPPGDEDIRIAPVILGSGRGGFFQIVLGAALIGAAFLTGGASLAAGKLAFSGLMGQMAFGMGVAMVLGGVSQLLTRQPQGITGVESPDNGASYNFNGPVNVTAQGNPVPVLYGEMIVGSVTVSGDMYSEDQQ
ncbi:tail assembly protein [Paracandidimonas soli]|uniref:Putative phage tail protein n=1 Tax=Paracandidimonas soli TaxID=1917182 RepID=A0A4R3UYC0_9BURK|nr:tail assembly protein [Paracandidimonas soli]TCU97326.1 putative phage tail protein [Paracandidimonas soli]